MNNYQRKINVEISRKDAKRIRRAMVKGYLRMMSEVCECKC